MTSPFVAIVGGGISGLAAAYELQQRGVPFTLIEQSGTCGGVVRTEHVGGYTIDGGPDALLIQKPAAIELCRELGLADRLRPQLHRATFVVRNGRLRELPAASVLGIPTRWLPFVTTRAFSWRGKLRMGAELFVRRAVAGEDESIALFIGRRFGREAVDYLAEPLLAGIHGGHPAQLSMHAAFPRLLELEQQYGSVIAGLRAMALRKPAAVGVPSPFVSLPGGMRELTEALLRRLPPASIHTNAGVSDRRSGRVLCRARRFADDAPAAGHSASGDVAVAAPRGCRSVGAVRAHSFGLGRHRGARLSARGGRPPAERRGHRRAAP